ncbi:hypothetical protein Ga0466249_000017 [Sporomusaceae bacterium BoRhaA]|uniref:YwmB family TATA-box binding protein n=1 Tax=Pelorhabdus rhamnosifermentans TaxID=2772457 RepID=UPI001C061D05|nr:YwmB family TATA-box binding protein [Pelorhabdus rhamnosifermentans]MBU2698938.1 hypothetical protein [Pelorhabdus rhamnosifermentans]
MKKVAWKWLSFGLIAVYICIIVTYGGQQKCALPVLSKALSTTGAEVAFVDIQGWVKQEHLRMDEAALEENVRESFDKLGYNGNDVQIEKKQNSYFCKVRGELRDPNLVIVVMSQMIYAKGIQPAVSYTAINAEIQGQNASGEEWERKIGKILAEIGPRPRINTCLVGRLDGKLNKNNLEHRLFLAFHSIQAVVQEPMFVDDIASFTGYTPNLTEFFTVNEQKVNVHMAVRYHPSEERTYVTIGTPVITRGY